jgi:hypothetical protein
MDGIKELTMAKQQPFDVDQFLVSFSGLRDLKSRIRREIGYFRVDQDMLAQVGDPALRRALQGHLDRMRKAMERLVDPTRPYPDMRRARQLLVAHFEKFDLLAYGIRSGGLVGLADSLRDRVTVVAVMVSHFMSSRGKSREEN